MVRDDRNGFQEHPLHLFLKNIIAEAIVEKQAIAFEDITGVRKLYRTGNGQGRGFRGRMNSWPFAELKRQVEYKASWGKAYPSSR